MSIEYLMVRKDVAREVGVDAAYLLAYLSYVSKKMPKDTNGFFELDASFVQRGLFFNRNKFHHNRSKLANAGYLDYVAGKSQNAKPRYKLL